MTKETTDNYFMEIKVPFPSQRYAEIAYNSLRVDKEPRKGGCRKTLQLDGCTLHVKLEADEARILRVSSNSFLDFLTLVTETMEKFGPPQPIPKI